MCRWNYTFILLAATVTVCAARRNRSRRGLIVWPTGCATGDCWTVGRLKNAETKISACPTFPFQHTRNPDLGAALAFAFVRGFHESKQFNRFLRRNGSDSGPEEFYHLGDKRVIAIVGAHRAFAFLTLGRTTITFRIFPIDARAPTFPDAFDLDQAVAGGAALDAFATGAHHREERFDAVNAVPEKVGMRFFQVARTGRFRAQNFADRPVADRLGVLAVSKR